MKKKCVLWFVALVLLPCLAWSDAPPIGKVKTAKGEVVVVRNGRQTPLRIGDPLFPNDVVQTGVSGSAGMIFEDNTVLSLGTKSRVVIDRYVFAPEKGQLSIILRLLKGTASYLSGIIGKQSPESVKFKTPDATIGVRGTKFLVRVRGR